MGSMALMVSNLPSGWLAGEEIRSFDGLEEGALIIRCVPFQAMSLCRVTRLCRESVTRCYAVPVDPTSGHSARTAVGREFCIWSFSTNGVGERYFSAIG